MDYRIVIVIVVTLHCYQAIWLPSHKYANKPIVTVIHT